MAQAMSEVLHCRGAANIRKQAEVDEERVTYIPIKEINLDDNGLKDASFAHILESLATQPSLKRICYINNEIGAKSIAQLARILSSDHESDLNDLRITAVKSSKHEVNLLLQALAKCTNRLVRLRLSHIQINEFVLMESLKQMVFNMPHIQELNLSFINVHGRQLADLMEVIQDNCQQIQYLNLSYNSLPSNLTWQQKFLHHLVILINTSSKLIDIDLSGMNLRENVKAIQWPLAKSKTLEAIHLSDNNLPKPTEINMLMVFGVKCSGDDVDNFSITAKLDPRLLKRAAMTTVRVNNY